jgi:hypothetical protein
VPGLTFVLLKRGARHSYQPQRPPAQHMRYRPQRHSIRLRLTPCWNAGNRRIPAKRWDVGAQVQIDINQSAAQRDLMDNGRVAFFVKAGWATTPMPKLPGAFFTVPISARRRIKPR